MSRPRDFYRLTPTFPESLAYGDGDDIPQIDAKSGYVEFFYSTYNVSIAIERCTPAGHAEVKVWSGEGELFRGLAWQQVKLLSQNSVSGLIRDLKAQAEHTPWPDMIRYCAWKAVHLAREGEQAKSLLPSEESIIAPEYLVWPFIFRGHSTVFYGPKAVLKSYLALAIALIVQLPLPDNGIGLKTLENSTRVLFCDWEDHEDTFRRRWGAVQRGFGLSPDLCVDLLYKRMTGSLAGALDSLEQVVSDENVGLIICDSIGPGSGGDLNAPETALRFNDCLRSLGTSSLSLAHTSKDNTTREKTIFGSQFYRSAARMVWRIDSEGVPGETERLVGLHNTDANLTGLHSPVGLKFSFTDNLVRLSRVDVGETALADALPLSLQIKNLLRDGPLTAREVCEALDKGENTIKPTLTRMAKRGVVVKLGDHKWGLREHEGS